MTICARNLQLLAPCLHDLPDYNSMSDKDVRYRHRHVDLMVTSGVRDVFVQRAKVIKLLRKYLDERDFIEVETPMLAEHAGGAIAKPFETFIHSHNTKLYMRIAPELYLKQLIMGGMDRVYEIGKSFRNEGTDLTHNPEFTTVEFYQAYENYEGMLNTTEELLRTIAMGLCGPKVTLNIPARGVIKAQTVEVDFNAPFRESCACQNLLTI